MMLDPNRHMDEEEIERYSMGRIPEQELAPFEEHLLLCDSCRESVAESDVYVAAIRQAVQQYPMEQQERKRRSGIFSLLIPAFATLFLVVLVTMRALGPSHPAAPVSMVAINLEAARGAGIQARVPEATGLNLQFELARLTSSAYYRLEILNNAGKRVWAGRATSGPMRASATAPPMRAGIYFVRLYLPSGELLREYGVSVGAGR